MSTIRPLFDAVVVICSSISGAMRRLKEAPVVDLPISPILSAPGPISVSSALKLAHLPAVQLGGGRWLRKVDERNAAEMKT